MTWEPPPESPRSATRSSSSRSDTSPPIRTTHDLLPKFKGYIDRGNFEGPNKTEINDANCGNSPLKFLMLFTSDFILTTFVVATNYYGNTFTQDIGINI